MTSEIEKGCDKFFIDWSFESKIYCFFNIYIFGYICRNIVVQMKIHYLGLKYLIGFGLMLIVTLTNCEHEPFEPIVSEETVDTTGVIDTTDTSNNDTTTIDTANAPSFSSEVKPIIDASCATEYCHSSTGQFPALTSYTEIKEKADRVKATTSSGSMPKVGSLTSSEIETIAKWVDAGAPNN